MLDSGEFTTVTEIAAHEKMSFTYVSRVLRLSLLAPDIVDASGTSATGDGSG